MTEHLSDESAPVSTESIVETHVPAALEEQSDGSWLSALEDQITDLTAEQQYEEPSAGAFLERVYSLTLTAVAELASEDPVEEWLDDLEPLVHAASTDDAHDRDPTDFVVHVYISALLRLSEGTRPESVDAGYSELFERALETIDSDVLPHWYRTYVRLLRSSNRHPRDWLPWLVSDAVGRADRRDERICETDEQWIALVVAVTAEVVRFVHLGVQAGSELAEGHFDDVVQTVTGTLSDDGEFLQAVRTQVAARLEDEYGDETAAAHWQDAVDAATRTTE